MMDLKKLATDCNSIIISPENNIDSLINLARQSNKEDLQKRRIIDLSLCKVFTQILPLYRIRSISEKVKTKGDESTVKAYDKKLLKAYTIFIKRIATEKSHLSAHIASILLPTAEHFNLTDTLISTVLYGTTISSSKISQVCRSTIKDRFINDTTGEISFNIINAMFENDFHPELLNYLLEIPFLKDLMEEPNIPSLVKYNPYCDAPNHKKPSSQKKKAKDKFFSRTRSMDKQILRDEKQRRIMEEKSKSQNLHSERIDRFRNHRKIVDAIQRLYFLVLRDKMVDKYCGVFKGLSYYKRFVREDFLEGLYVLLNDAISDCTTISALNGIQTILDIYGTLGYDFKRAINALYQCVSPFNYELRVCYSSLIENAITRLFFDIRQPLGRVNAMVDILTLLYSLRGYHGVRKIIGELVSFYDIDFKDCFKCDDELNQFTDIDCVPSRPFYNYYTHRRML